MKKTNNKIYTIIGLGTLALVIIATVFFLTIKKKKRNDN